MAIEEIRKALKNNFIFFNGEKMKLINYDDSYDEDIGRNCGSVLLSFEGESHNLDISLFCHEILDINWYNKCQSENDAYDDEDIPF